MHSSLRMKLFNVVGFPVCVNSTGEDYSVMVVDMYFALQLVDDSLLVVACPVSVLVDDNVNAAFVDADIFPLLMRSYLLLIEQERNNQKQMLLCNWLAIVCLVVLLVDEDGFFEETIVDVCFAEVQYVVISILVEVSVCDNVVPDVTGILELEKCNSVPFDEILEDVKVEKDVVGQLVEKVETLSIVCVDVDIRENELEVLIIGASVDNET